MECVSRLIHVAYIEFKTPPVFPSLVGWYRPRRSAEVVKCLKRAVADIAFHPRLYVNLTLYH